MMNPAATGQCLAGFEVDGAGEIQATWTDSMPAAFVYTPFKQLSVPQQKLANKFYQGLANRTGKDVTYIWDNRHYALPVKPKNWVDLLGATLQESGLTNSEAYALANYAGGAARHEGLFGVSPVAPKDGINTFLDVDKMLSEGTPQVVRLSNALLKLKKINPGAHEYVVNVIAAKAAARQASASQDYSQDVDRVIKKELEIAKDVVMLPAKAAEGGLDLAKTTVGLIQYLPWIIGGTVVLVAYLAYRNRETIAKVGGTVARKYVTGGLG